MIYVVAFDPIKILTCWGPQNDRQNLSFVRAFNVVGEKMAQNTIQNGQLLVLSFFFRNRVYYCFLIG